MRFCFDEGNYAANGIKFQSLAMACFVVMDYAVENEGVLSPYENNCLDVVVRLLEREIDLVGPQLLEYGESERQFAEGRFTKKS